ncbi:MULTISPECIES: hypothetical protein [Paenibacillus]|uniref:Uncharacterized protein n=1 Tax=Paenibacillus borealis TaxID=160799 RepID=A0ABX3GVQ8_PAEBO|nr:hypothetical protein [Paenibacillus borealis]OMD38537.1 hypothetical protein BSK56_30295 [Paenibacillus borealis]
MISLSRTHIFGRRLGLMILGLLFTVSVFAASLLVPEEVFAAPTSSIDLYLDNTFVGTITSTDINANADYFDYTGNRNNLTNAAYTAYGSPVLELFQSLIDNEALSVDVDSDVISVTFSSLVGPNYTRTFNNPGTQLFSSRYTFPNPDIATSGTLVPAILATDINGSGEDVIRLLFGTLAAQETNIPYFLSNINRIDLYTSGTFTGGYAY